MRYFLWALLLLWLCFQTKAQVSDSLYKALPDSLRPKNRNAVSGNETVRILTDISDATIQHHFRELNNIVEQLTKEIPTKRTNDEKLLYADAIAQFYIQSGNYGKAFDYCHQVVKYGQDTKMNRDKVRDPYINLCTFYSIKQRPDSAITMLHRASNVARAIGDSVSIMHVYTGYKYIYSYLYLFHNALDYAEKEEKAFPATDRWSDKHTAATMSRGNLYTLLHREEKKGVYADSANAIFRRVMRVRKTDSAIWYSSCYTMLGYIQYMDGHYQQALTLLDSAILSQYNQPGVFEPRLSTRRTLLRGSCLALLGQPEGIKMLRELDISPRDFQSLEMQNKLLYEHALKQGDWKAALNYYTVYKNSGDSLDIIGQRGKVFEAEQKYSVAQKEATIAQLENKNLQSQVTRNTIVVMAVIAILLLAILATLFYLRNKRQQAQQIAERQKLTDELHLMEQDMELERLNQQAEKEAAITGERKTISENMHDEVSSSLAALRYLIADIRQQAQSTETRQALTEVEDEAKTVYLQSREFMHRLHNDRMGQTYNVVDLLENLSLRFGEGSGLQVVVSADADTIQHYFTTQQHAELYRVIKEAVANSMKHSGARRIEIRVYAKRDQFYFDIKDDGRGLRQQDNSGLGLTTMQQRIAALKGHMQINSEEQGLHLSGNFPMAAN